MADSFENKDVVSEIDGYTAPFEHFPYINYVGSSKREPSNEIIALLMQRLTLLRPDFHGIDEGFGASDIKDLSGLKNMYATFGRNGWKIL